MRAILTYHSIDPSGSVISLDPDLFRAQMACLAAAPVDVVPLGEIGTLSAGVNAAALTFDDGFGNFETEALPELRRWGFPATLFVVPGHAGGTNRWDGRSAPGIPELPLLDWDGLGRAAEAGVELGAHTMTHPWLPSLDPERVWEELERSAETIRERTGGSAMSFAYPYGAVSPTVVDAARAMFRRACTTELRVLGREEDPHLLPRLDIHYFRGAKTLSGWGGRAFRWRLGLRARGRWIRSLLPGPPESAELRSGPKGFSREFAHG